MLRRRRVSSRPQESGELLRHSLSISEPRTLLELAALYAGIKRVVRWTMQPDAVPDRISNLARVGMHAMVPALFTKRMRRDTDDNEYSVLTDTLCDEACLQVVYVYRDGHRADADELYGLEKGGGTSTEIGEILGYPACCCEAYKRIERGKDWLESMLACTPPGSTSFAACNRCARLFGDWGVLPDYFPCSFSCVRSAELGQQIDLAGRGFGLGPYLDQAWRELIVPIAVSSDSVSRLGEAGREVVPRQTVCLTTRFEWASGPPTEKPSFNA